MFSTLPVQRRSAPTPLTPPQKAEKAARRRKRWVTTAVVLSLLAIGVEGRFHLCASNLFDPLPDLITGVAYAWVVFFLWFNQVVLSAAPPQMTETGETATPPPPLRQNPLMHWLGPKRATGVALAGTSVALLVAGMAVWMFAPLLLVVPMLPVLFVTGLGNLGSALIKGTTVPPTSDIIPMLSGPLLLVPFIDFFVLLFQLRALRKIRDTAAADNQRWNRRVALGTRLLLFAAVFFLMVRPALIGFAAARSLHEKGAAQKRAFSVLRFLGGQETLLDLTYRRNPPYWVCFGYQAKNTGPLPWTGYSWNGMDAEATQAARRAFFLLTGTPFESVPRPASAFRQNTAGQPDDVAVEETGGLLVGRPVPGLSLAASGLVFSTDAQTETGEGTWTMTFRNATDAPQEARADVLLPPGATCHAVSLWINGQEKPAAFGSPQKVRAAYQEIAVVRRRDPLLVTMPAPDHLLVQCFPVAPHSEMKIKLGITTPLAWRKNIDETNATLELVLPAFGAVNFDVPDRLPYSYNVSQNGLDDRSRTFVENTRYFTPYRVSLPPNQAVLLASYALDGPEKGDVLAPCVVRTVDPLAFPDQPVDLWLLLDASQGMNTLYTQFVQSGLRRTLAKLPAGSRVFFADTDDPDGVYCAALSRPFPDYLDYSGGTDPAPAIARTLHDAREKGWAARHASVVLFLHAASPAHVSDLSAVRKELHQHNVRIHGSVDGPALVCVQLAPHAPDAVAMDLAGFPNVTTRRALPGSDVMVSTAEALRFAAQAACASDDWAANGDESKGPLLPMGGRILATNGVTFAPAAKNDALPDSLSRLRQASLTNALWLRSNQTAKPGEALDLRIAAGQPAAIARLVTPVSSAVVLETQAQYEAHGLDAKSGKRATQTPKPLPTPISPTSTCRNPDGRFAFWRLAVGALRRRAEAQARRVVKAASPPNPLSEAERGSLLNGRLCKCDGFSNWKKPSPCTK